MARLSQCDLLIDPALRDVGQYQPSGHLTVNTPFPRAPPTSISTSQSLSDWGTNVEEPEHLRRCITHLKAIIDDHTREVAFLKSKLTRQDALLKCLVEETGLDEKLGLENEAGHSIEFVLHKKKKKQVVAESVSWLLTYRPVKQLNAVEKRARSYIIELVGAKLKDLAKTPQGENISLYEHLGPGEHQLENEKILLPDFERPVTDQNNERLIAHAASLVYKDAKADGYIDKEVTFTELDVEQLGKKKFKSWKTAYEKATDERKAFKAQQTSKKTTRDQRKRQKKNDHQKAVQRFKEQFREDPSVVLDTDWMSDYVSELDNVDATEVQKARHRLSVLSAAGFIINDQTANEMVFERVRPGFRSEEINKVYLILDHLVEDQKRSSGHVKGKSAHRRVDLGRVNNNVPDTVPFPFMVNNMWSTTHVKGKGVLFLPHAEDPKGIGSKIHPETLYMLYDIEN